MRCLCDAPEEDPTRQTLVGLLAEMSYRAGRLPYLLLHYINVRSVAPRAVQPRQRPAPVLTKW